MSLNVIIRNNDVFENGFEVNEEELAINLSSNRRPSLVPRQISFSQRRATIGEIILILLPYFIFIFDIFFFFLLRGFQLKSPSSPTD